MKIRHKATIWITVAVILVSLVFSLGVFFEMTKQNYRQVDDELTATVENIFKIIKTSEAGHQDQVKLATEIFLDSHRYWIRVWRNDTLAYSSKMAQMIDLPLNFDKKRFSITVKFPRPEKVPGKKPYKKRTFRVRTAKISSQTASPGYRIYVALPLKKLTNETTEVVKFIVVGLSISTMLLILLSYFLAGRILRPIRKITNLAREIDEKDLTGRIPLGLSHDELYELAFALNQMLDRLQYSFNRQKEFIASAAHELNTPIANVRLFIEQGINNSALPEPFRNDLVRQHEILLRMGRLLRSLMILSALEMKRKIQSANFDFRTLTDSVIADFQPLFELKKIPLETKMPEQLPYYGDKEQLRRVVVNLIDNAIKYNAPGGLVTIELKKVNHNLFLKIANESNPIPENDLKNIFEQFYRVEKSRSLEFGGCGLGLTIVREIVSLHKGKVYMENRPSGQVRVVVQLPDNNQSSEGQFSKFQI